MSWESLTGCSNKGALCGGLDYQKTPHLQRWRRERADMLLLRQRPNLAKPKLANARRTVECRGCQRGSGSTIELAAALKEPQLHKQLTVVRLTDPNAADEMLIVARGAVIYVDRFDC